jgi:hypothetical protein
VRTLLVSFHPSKSPDVIFSSNPESSPGSSPSSSPGSSPGSNPGLINRYPQFNPSVLNITLLVGPTAF